VSFPSRPAVIWIGLVAIGASIAIGQPQKPNRMVFFHMEGQGKPAVFGMMRDDLLKLDGKGAGRIKGALEHGPVKVWQYTLRNEGSGKWRLAPDHEIELTSADASSIKFGARIAIPPD
jgi:hypothetical protein